MRDWRNQIKLLGNIDRSRMYIGQAQSQMEILKNQMAFGDLSQGSRNVWIDGDVFVRCTVCFETLVCSIWTPIEKEEEESEYSYEKRSLLVVTGDRNRKLELSSVRGKFRVGENVSCGYDGYGDIESISGSNLYGSFVHCFGGTVTGLTSGATGSIRNCYRDYYENTYEHREYTDGNLAEAKNNYDIFSALDVFPAGSIPCENLGITVRHTWTKVYGDFTVGTFTYTDRVYLGYQEYWGAVASYQGKYVSWEGSVYFGQFKREFVRNIHEILVGQGELLHIGWDIWVEGSEDKGDLEYFCGLMTDKEKTLYVFQLDVKEMQLKLVTSRKSTVKKDKYYNEDYPHWCENYTRLLGYGYKDGEHIAWWGQPGRDEPLYYKENLLTGITTEYSVKDEQVINETYLGHCLWNPVKRELCTMADSSNGLADFEVADLELEILDSALTIHHPGVVIDGHVTATGDQLIRVKHNGEYFYFPTICYQRDDKYPLTYYYRTTHNCILKKLLEKENYGKFELKCPSGTFTYSKGNSAQYYNMPTSTRSWVWGLPSDCSGTTDLEYPYPPQWYGECRPFNRKRYDFIKWIWSKNSQAHRILEDNQVQLKSEDSDDIFCVWEDDWKTKDVGDTAVLKSGCTWPYDSGWSSILLYGLDKNDVDCSGSVIYRDLEYGGGFYLADQNGDQYSIGSYDRCFFTIDYEEING